MYITLFFAKESNSNIYERYCKFSKLFYVEFDDYLEEFKRLYKIAYDTKARNFQYRQLTFALYPSVVLKKWGVVEMDIRNFLVKDKLLNISFGNVTQ